MMHYLIRLTLISLLLFSGNGLAQTQDNWRMHLYTTTFPIKDPTVRTPYFTITLPPSLTIGNIQNQGTFVEFTSLSLYLNKFSKERLTVHVYTKKLQITSDRAMQIEMQMAMMGKFLPDLSPPAITPEEKQYLMEAMDAKPQEFKIGDLSYAITTCSLRSVKLVIIAATVKNVFYTFQLASFDDDKAVRQNQINEMIASIKSIEYNDVPSK